MQLHRLSALQRTPWRYRYFSFFVRFPKSLKTRETETTMVTLVGSYVHNNLYNLRVYRVYTPYLTVRKGRNSIEGRSDKTKPPRLDTVRRVKNAWK